MRGFNLPRIERAQWREELRQKFTIKLSPGLNVLRGINRRSEEQESSKQIHKRFDKLFSLIYRTDILIQALGNIEKNKGRLTKGVDQMTIDGISLLRIKKLSNSLKNGTFKWNPVKRIYLEKPKLLKKSEKKKMRPIGIPTSNDKIVQEGIRLILEAIYEPKFNKQNSNWGFRPKKSCINAIELIKRKATGSTYAIEGDIDGAYNNVDHDRLTNILKMQINDSKFINFLNKGFKSGLLEKGAFENTLLGVPQGGIAFPILFNIYMHEYYKYITEELTKIINENINDKEDRKDQRSSKK